MLCSKNLLSLELFQKLPSDLLEWICDHSKEIRLDKGSILIKEGDHRRGFFIMLSGSIGVTCFREGVQMSVGQHHAPSFFGEIQILSDDLIPVTLKALIDCHLYEISGENFLKILHECRDFEKKIFQTAYRGVRGLESFVQNREKIAALETLAAGLAHEVNNPVAALVRTLKDITPAMFELQHINFAYGKHNVEDEQIEKLFKARDDGYKFIINNFSEPLTLIDREEAILEWLEDYGVKDAWTLSESLAAGNIKTQLLDELVECWQDDTTKLMGMGLRWLALSFEVITMIKVGLRSAERVSDFVQSMGSYSHLDRGAKQIIDIHQGLEDTLQLLSYKLKQSVKIKRIYDPTLPKILAYGSELNQVWTNLINNSLDAIEKKGLIKIITSSEGGLIKVQIIDSGEGISSEVQSRIFEPFFTTKSVGLGSGLGLDTVRRIVENRHRGSISFASKPGNTCFSIHLPSVEMQSYGIE